MLLMRLPLVLLLPLLALAQHQLTDTSNPLLQRANTLLATGAFSDAIHAFTQLLESPPPPDTQADSATASYLLYYKRATAYYSLSRHQNALEDYEKVLELNDGMYKVWLMKARCFAKEGQWAEARTALKKYVALAEKDKSSKEADPGAADLMFELAEAEQAEKKAKLAVKTGGWPACQAACSDALRVGTHALHLREMRAECALADAQLEDAIADYGRLSHLRPSNTDLLLRISTLTFYFLKDPHTPAMSHVKACLHSDPEHPGCLAAHRTIKSLTKALDQVYALKSEGKWATLKRELDGPDGLLAKFDKEMAKALKALKPPLPATLNPNKLSAVRMELLTALCASFTHTNAFRAGLSHYEALLSFNPESTEALVGLGQLALENEEYEEAVRLLEKAWEAEGRPRSGETAERFQKAQARLKQSKTKDYYKVLGVSRDADQKTIKKAYRKAAMRSHPDKGGTEQEMAAVNEAYEVLSDDELRRRYDAGDDPNDPLSGQGGQPFFQGAGPFAHFFQQQGGNPFGGRSPGGGQFQFHFRG